MQLSELSSAEAVLTAISECDELGRDVFLEKYGYKRSRKYPLRYAGQIYDSKAIVGVALGRQLGIAPLKSTQFSGGFATVVAALRRLGFNASEALHPMEQLKVGLTYFRKDLLDRFGGQMQGGIWTPREFPVVFVFSGDSGKAYGNRDGWVDGVYRYTGEGQQGPMTFDAGNKAIRDHRMNKKDLLLFSDLGKGREVRYEGLFECASWTETEGPDKSGATRTIIVFDLVPVGSGQAGPELADSSVAVSLSITDLRRAAYEAASPPKKRTSAVSAQHSWYERSEAIRAYVKARAKGLCEACDAPAPFHDGLGKPFLEAHHTTRLADSGPDHPASVAAICPNCHRRAHHGLEREKWNRRLEERVKAKEAQIFG